MLNIELITYTRFCWKIQGETIQLPGILGYFQILTNHLPIISSLISGNIIINNIKNMIQYNEIENINFFPKYVIFSIENGVVEFSNNTVNILGNFELIKQQ